MYVLRNYNYDATKLPVIIDTKPGIHLKDTEHPRLLFSFLFDDGQALRIFTVGSNMKHALSVGMAYICLELNLVQTSAINHNASIYTAECKALVDAMQISLKNKDRNVDIFTDSLSAVQVLGGYSIGD